MKRKGGGNRKITKGMPSAVLLSIAIHVALFLLAGMLVVFTVVKKKEIEFEPPKAVERPKMKLKKPKVKIKKTSRPKPTTRIVTKMNRASMPDIQLPEMSGMSEGLVGGLGGFDMMPDLGEISVLGSGQSIGNDFVGTFYDFKRDRSGRPIPMTASQFSEELGKFVRRGWDTSMLARYYRSPEKLYATTFMVPPMFSVFAPRAFGVDTAGYYWMAHYEGELVSREGITFRFRGMGDSFLCVRVDGEVVVANPGGFGWHSTSADSRKYRLGMGYAEVGDWITLEPGVPLAMEVMFGERLGGEFSATLVVEEQGVEYERNDQGGPILPMFKTAVPSLDLVEAIHAYLVPGEACVTNGPVFSDYDTSGGAAGLEPGRAKPSVSDDFPVRESALGEPSARGGKGMHSWNFKDGRVLEAGFVTVLGGDVVLRDLRDRIVRFPMDRFSEKDREFIELAMPPVFNISFSKQSKKLPVRKSPFEVIPPPRIFEYVFSAKLKQTSSGAYNHELSVEFFAVGEEIDGDNYILFDRQQGNFMPSEENQRSFRLDGGAVKLMDFDLLGQRRGEKYGGFLVVVRDRRGEIVQYKTSHKWLFEKLENLRKLPVGKHFNKQCIRVGPPRPKRSY